jgi:hypothetical protein
VRSAAKPPGVSTRARMIAGRRAMLGSAPHRPRCWVRRTERRLPKGSSRMRAAARRDDPRETPSAHARALQGVASAPAGVRVLSSALRRRERTERRCSLASPAVSAGTTGNQAFCNEKSPHDIKPSMRDTPRAARNAWVGVIRVSVRYTHAPFEAGRCVHPWVDPWVHPRTGFQVGPQAPAALSHNYSPYSNCKTSSKL